MESIKILREICQAPRRNTDNWHMKHIARKPSIYITWLLLHTPITPTGATFLFLLTGLAACVIFLAGTSMAFLAGSIVLEIWYVMDMVDGEIARYRKRTSLTGIYFDSICHYIVHPILFFCIGIGLYKMGNGCKTMFLVSLLAGYSISMISLSTDMVKGTLYYKMKGIKPDALAAAGGSDDPKEPEGGKGFRGVALEAFSIIHMLCEMPAAMNMLLIASILQCLIKVNLIKALVIFFAIGATLVWITRVTVFILQKKMDGEAPSL